MKSRTPRRTHRKALPLLLLPFLLVLAGCLKLDMNIDITSADEATLSMEIVDTMGMLELATDGCEQFGDDVEDGTVEKFTDSEGNTGCRVSGEITSDMSSNDFSISQDGNEIVFRMNSLDTGIGLDDDEEIDLDDPMFEMFSPDVAINVTFPGKVTYASEGGEINGSTVTWSGLGALANKIEARGQSSGGVFGGGSSGDDKAEETTPPEQTTEPETDTEDGAATDDEAEATSPAAADDSDTQEKSGFPLWLTILLGILLLVVLFLIVMVARRQRKDPPTDPGMGQYPGQQYPGQHQQQYPQQGQYPTQQYPPQGQYPTQQYPQQGEYPGQQHPQQGGQWDQTQQYPQQGQYPTQQYPQQGGQWDQTQQYPQQGGQWDQTQQWNQGNGQPPQQ